MIRAASSHGRYLRAPTGPSSRLHGVMAALDIERPGRRLRHHGARDHGKADQLHAILRVRDLLVDQRLDVLVVDALLAVGERLESDEGVLALVSGKMIAELLQLVDEGMAAGM